MSGVVLLLNSLVVINLCFRIATIFAEHVAFENLPNYTGHWDKMKAGVIQKIRNGKPEEDKEDEDES